MRRCFIIVLTALILPLAAWARADSAPNGELPDLFLQHGVHGTLLIASLDGQREYALHAQRAGKSFAAASTFKIANTLIALQEALIRPDERFVWDGSVHEFADWNADQTLASAFKVSCVWCYQQIARKVGRERYQDWLARLQLGELRQPFEVDRFWLDGQLRLSAREQVDFLRRMLQGDLPIDASHVQTLRQIMRIDSGPGWVLSGKTGWAVQEQPQLGWFVGFLERDEAIWLFALNMDVRQPADLPLRQRIVRQGLQALGLLP